MSNMKCPLCGSQLSCCFRDGEQLFYCSNLTCKAGAFYATDNMWQEFIRTYKNWEITRKAVVHANWFFDGDYNVDAKTMHNEIRCALKGMTILEQKDEDE